MVLDPLGTTVLRELEPRATWQVTPTPERSGPAARADFAYIAVICPRCGANHHLAQCPQVKSVEYQADGHTIKRVEFFETVGSRPITVMMTTNVTDFSAVSPAAYDLVKLAEE